MTQSLVYQYVWRDFSLPAYKGWVLTVRMGNRTYEGVMALVIGNRKVLLSAPYKFRRQDLA
jgi:hypothetical protein